MAARLPEKVRAQIILAWSDVRAGNEATTFALRPVGLDAEWVDDEHEGAIQLVEGVEVDLDVVIARDAIAVGECGGDRSGIGERFYSKVDRVGRIPDADFSGIGSGASVGGLVEREAVENCGAGPDRFVEPAVDLDGRLDFRRGDVDL